MDPVLDYDQGSPTDNLSNDDLSEFLNEGYDSQFNSSFQLNESTYFDIDSLISKFKQIEDHFTVLSLNIQSIKSKWSLFTASLDALFDKDIYPCAILVQETWLDFDSNLYDLPNYDCFSLEGTCSRHGGLKTYIRRDFSAKNLNLYCSSDVWEGLFIETRNNKSHKKIVVSNIYKPLRGNNNIDNI